MNSTASELVSQAATGLREVLGTDAIAGLPDAERARVLAEAGEVMRLAEAVIVESMATSEPDFSHQYGCRGQNELLRRALRVDAGTAARFGRGAEMTKRVMSITSGERLEARFPRLREALMDGVIGLSGLLAATGPLDEAHHRIGTQERMMADADLAAYARGSGPYAHAESGQDSDVDEDAASAPPAATAEDLKQLAMEWAMALDPDGAEPSDQGAQTKRSFSIGALKDGFHRAQGNLLPEVAAQLQAIFDAYNNPKAGGAPVPESVSFRPSDEAVSADEADPFNSDPRRVIDPRTAAQKRHDALAAALGIAARHDEMPSLGGGAPTLVVHVNAKDYLAGTGWATIAGSMAPVPLGVAAHTACAGGVQRVLFDEGRIVGISVSDRIFTVHQRRAIVLRDKECLIPGCHVPAAWCEFHHVIDHAHGGPTSTDNGVPLCWWHHRNIDRSEWDIRMRDGTPQIRGPGWWDDERRWRVPRHSRAAPDPVFTG